MIGPTSLRPVRPLDRDLLLRIYTSTRQADLDLVPWSDEQKREFAEMQFTAQTRDYESRFPDSEHSIILADDQEAGRIWIDRRFDEIRLLDIAILPRFRNRGIGQTMIERLQAEASQADIALRHSVFNTNQDAIRLYERMGFAIIEDFETYVLMEWQR